MKDDSPPAPVVVADADVLQTGTGASSPADLDSPLFDDKEKGLTMQQKKLSDYQKSSFIHTIAASNGETPESPSITPDIL